MDEKRYADAFPLRGEAARGHELMLGEMNGAPQGRYHAAKKGFSVEMVLSDAPTVMKSITPLAESTAVENAVLQLDNQNAVLPRAFDLHNLPMNDRWVTLFKGASTAINGYCAADGNYSRLVRDHDADHIWFVYHGLGQCYTDYGNFEYRAGDFIYIPRGTLTCFKDHSERSHALMIGIESSQGFGKRARSAYDNIMVPYNEFAVKLPIPRRMDDRPEFQKVLVRRGGRWCEIEYAYSPFLCLAWQGTSYPFVIHSDELNLPSVSAKHPDPTNFGVFAAPDGSAMVSVLGPRRVHSLPYDHDNPLTEVLFYAKPYDARKGSSGGVGSQGTCTVHPMGVWHGPQMAAFEEWQKPASPEELPWRDELAIMFETSDALYPCKDVLPILIARYEKSWLESWEEHQKRQPRGMPGVGGW